MKFYLAGRYSRRKELLGYAEQLKALGHEVTSRWLDGKHEAKDKTATPNEMARWAKEDLKDIRAAQALILFTESELTPRGGRLVEFGYAVGKGKRVYTVGPMENIFCAHVNRFDTWEEFFHHAKTILRDDTVF